MAAAFLLSSCQSYQPPPGQFTSLQQGPLVYDMPEAANQFTSAYKAYRTAGLPYSSSDLGQDQRADDSQNAATYLLSAHQKYQWLVSRLRRAESKQSLQARSPGFASSDEYGLGVLDRYDASAVFKLLSAALQKPVLDFHHDPETRNADLYPELSEMKGLVRLLCARAERNSSQGKPEEAASNLNEAWNLAWLLPREKVTIADLVAASSSTIIAYATENCIQKLLSPTQGGSPNPTAVEKLHRFRLALDLAPKPARLKENTLAEIGRTVALARAMDGRPTVYSWSGSLGDPGPITDQFPKTEQARGSLARFFQFWTSNRSALDELDRDPIAAATKIDNSKPKRGSVSYIFLQDQSMDLLPMAKSVVRAFDQAKAETLLLAILDDRFRSGHWPKLQNKSDLRFGFMILSQFSAQVYLKPTEQAFVYQPVKKRSTRDDGPIVAAYPSLAIKHSG